MNITRKAKQMGKENDLSPEINQAYINLVGEKYAKAEDCGEAYQGQYASDEEFAQELAEELGAIPKDNPWPYYCIDWEWAARELMMDYSEQDGFYFKSL